MRLTWKYKKKNIVMMIMIYTGSKQKHTMQVVHLPT